MCVTVPGFAQAKVTVEVSRLRKVRARKRDEGTDPCSSGAKFNSFLLLVPIIKDRPIAVQREVVISGRSTTQPSSGKRTDHMLACSCLSPLIGQRG